MQKRFKLHLHSMALRILPILVLQFFSESGASRIAKVKRNSQLTISKRRLNE